MGHKKLKNPDNTGNIISNYLSRLGLELAPCILEVAVGSRLHVRYGRASIEPILYRHS